MRKLIFAVLFIGSIFIGYSYLSDKLLKPGDETNMDRKEKEEYLNSFDVLSEEERYESVMLSFQACMEMASAYKNYDCVASTVTDPEYANPNESLKDNGLTIFNKLSKGKAVIEFEYVLNRVLSEENHMVYDVKLILLQDSSNPKYQFVLSDYKITSIAPSLKEES